MIYKFFIVLFLFSVFNFNMFVYSDTEVTASYIILAERNIDFSFEKLHSVYEELEDMNILVNELNNLIELLYKAKIEYINGDLLLSSKNAMNIIEKCSEINIRAQNIASEQRVAEIRMKTNIFSRIILLIFLIIILFIWKLFKDYYILRTTSKMLVEN